MKKANLFLLLVFLFLYVPFSIQAQVPSLISYQGTLSDDNGEPVSYGVYTMSFKLYNSETGTTTVWEEDQSVRVVNGLFNVLLGKVEGFDIQFDEPYWLGISVDGRPEMSPRIELTSSAYSFMARTVSDGAITTHKLADQSVTQEKLVSDISIPISGEAGGDLTSSYPNPIVAAIQGRAVSSSSPSTGQVLKWTGSEWTPDTDENDGLTLPFIETVDIFGNIFDIKNSDPNTIVIRAEATSSEGFPHGVYGRVSSPGGTGVQGINQATNTYGKLGTTGYGVLGFSDRSNGVGVFGMKGTNASFAGYFSGATHVHGTLTKSSGSFKIDHPLDPEKKWLYHSFVESPDMMNVYNGNVRLDAQGEAWVDLPEYFGELNKDFRYQLTPIGEPGPDLFIAREISDNRFQIAGGNSGMKVSWQVTGIRNDPYARQNRIQVEVDKSSEEQGKYMHPEVYGLPEERSINASRLIGLEE